MGLGQSRVKQIIWPKKTKDCFVCCRIMEIVRDPRPYYWMFTLPFSQCIMEMICMCACIKEKDVTCTICHGKELCHAWLNWAWEQNQIKRKGCFPSAFTNPLFFSPLNCTLCIGINSRVWKVKKLKISGRFLGPSDTLRSRVFLQFWGVATLAIIHKRKLAKFD